MPFDVAQSPGYEISYLICILAAYSIVAVSAIEAFTFSVSLFIRATFSDLRVCLQQMDSELYDIDFGEFLENSYLIYFWIFFALKNCTKKR